MLIFSTTSIPKVFKLLIPHEMYFIMLTFCTGDKQVITCDTAIVRCIGTHMVHVTGRLPVGILDRTGDITLRFPIE